MEILHITDKKLKLTLSAEEAARYRLDGKRLEELGDVRALLGTLLSGAKGVTPFLSGRVLVQAYPMREGGCELFVTRLPTPRRERQETSNASPKKSAPSPTLWRFAAEEDLYHALATLPDLQKGTLYRITEDAFVLVLHDTRERACPSPLLEFATPLSAATIDLLLEHAEEVPLPKLTGDLSTL